MYDPFHTPSWDDDKSRDHYDGKRYSCDYCGITLEDHESYMREGKVYCGCCK